MNLRLKPHDLSLKQKNQIFLDRFYYQLAEVEGFKPPIRKRAYTGFRVRRIRSLCHTSKSESKSIKIILYYQTYLKDNFSNRLLRPLACDLRMDNLIVHVLSKC